MQTDGFIRPDEHVFICGSTGSGKSVLTDVYTAGMGSVIKLDIKNDTEARRRKGEPIWRGLVENEDFVVLRTLDDVFSSDFGKIVYVPTEKEMNQDSYNELCRYAYETGNTRLWIDELMLLCENASKYPAYLKYLSVAGRAFNASLICCSQRPSTIPGFILANMQHYFIFSLGQPQDRKRMSETVGSDKLRKNPSKKYAFWYYREGHDPDDIKQWILNIDR